MSSFLYVISKKKKKKLIEIICRQTLTRRTLVILLWYFGLLTSFLNVICFLNIYYNVMFEGIYEVSINETYRRMIRIKILTIRMLYLYKGTGNRK